METINHPALSNIHKLDSSRVYPRILIEGAQTGKSKTISNWSVSTDDGRATIRHHGTDMIQWNVADPTDNLKIGIGWGSVSDQSGLNGIFRLLGLNLRYSRLGWAHIEVFDPDTGSIIDSVVR